MDTNTTFDIADELLANTYAAIYRNGYQLVSVIGSGARPSWQYTIGMLHHDFPELLIIGIAPEQGAGVIDHIWDLMLDGDPPTLGLDEAHEFRGTPFRVVPVPNEVWDETDLFLGAIDYWRSLHDTPFLTGATLAWQIVWPDDDGRFPWDEAFDPLLRPLQPALCLGDELGDGDPDECGHDDCELCRIYGRPDER